MDSQVKQLGRECRVVLSVERTSSHRCWSLTRASSNNLRAMRRFHCSLEASSDWMAYLELLIRLSLRLALERHASKASAGGRCFDLSWQQSRSNNSSWLANSWNEIERDVKINKVVRRRRTSRTTWQYATRANVNKGISQQNIQKLDFISLLLTNYSFLKRNALSCSWAHSQYSGSQRRDHLSRLFVKNWKNSAADWCQNFC